MAPSAARSRPAGKNPALAREWPADAVERRPLASLTPYARNARTHSDGQVAEIARSIQEWGWTMPVLIDEAGGIIAGHGRVLAAQLLGLAEVPVMVARGWTEAQRRAYLIADNKLGLNAGWDDALLALEMTDLKAMGFDVGLTGFGPGEVEELFGRAAARAGLTDPDATPPVPAEPISRLGDVWLLGRHRIACGDCTSADDVAKLLRGAVPDLANCDPPYGISVVKGGSVGGAKPFGKVGGGKPHPFAGNAGRVDGPSRRAIIQPGVYAPIIGDDSTETAIKSHRVLADLGVAAIVLWGGNYFANELPPSRCWLVWDKENTGSFADVELAWTNRDAIARLFRHQWSGLIKASERGERRVHPTQKPVALAEWVIETVAPDAASYIDLFLGSGSSLIAAERKGIVCFGMEMAPAYIDVAVIRWQAFAGESATLEGDGRTFAEVSAAGRESPSAAA